VSTSSKILFVDDEPSALEGFRRALHGKFDIHTANGGGQGLVTIERDGPFAVVVSDMRMPGMDGAEFLAQVRNRAPLTVRMVLTGHAELRAAIDAVNRGNVFHFLTKPCQRDVLVAALQSGLDHYHAVIAEKDMVRRAQKTRPAQPAVIDWEASDPRDWENFQSPANLPGPMDARAHLESVAGHGSHGYVVLLHLSVLKTVEMRYGEVAAEEYLRIAAQYLQQSMRAGDRLFHWRRDVLMGVMQRFISANAVRMEMERLIADTRAYIIQVKSKGVMIACLITFDLLPAAQFSSAEQLIAACESRGVASAPEPVPLP
jgi:CheY-like chemotaxis protein/GGDEF domain-containing protein